MPDIGLLNQEETLRQIINIANSVSVPIVADVDTGYGGVTNVYRLVKQLIAAGVAGFCIEDQQWPKKCGHFEGKAVIPMEEHVAKIKAAVVARGDSGIVICGRTDARAPLGLAEAIRRAKAYAEAGADVVFVEAPQSEDELREIVNALPGVPLLVNFIEGGKTPMKYSVKKLEEMGFKIAMYSTAAVLAVQYSLNMVYSTIRDHGHTAPVRDRMATFAEYRDLLDENQWNELHEIPSEGTWSAERSRLHSPEARSPRVQKKFVESSSSDVIN
jgi:methylisocitrate lyase